MEAAIGLIAFLTFWGVLAAYSLRDGRFAPGGGGRPPSKEEEFASYGMTWDELELSTVGDGPVRVAAPTRARAAVGRMATRLAAHVATTASR
jgi:hypothetical protein